MKCRSCADNNLELILDLGDQPWGNDYKSINNYTECEKYPLRLFFVIHVLLRRLISRFQRK